MVIHVRTSVVVNIVRDSVAALSTLFRTLSLGNSCDAATTTSTNVFIAECPLAFYGFMLDFDSSRLSWSGKRRRTSATQLRHPFATHSTLLRRRRLVHAMANVSSHVAYLRLVYGTSRPESSLLTTPAPFASQHNARPRIPSSNVYMERNHSAVELRPDFKSCFTCRLSRESGRSRLLKRPTYLP